MHILDESMSELYILWVLLPNALGHWDHDRNINKIYESGTQHIT